MGIFRLARAHRAHAGEMLRALDLHPGQEILIMAIAESGPYPQTQNDLAQVMGVDHSTVAKSLRRMETAGLISRRQSDIDGRATIVFLTPKGVATSKKIERVWAELERVTVANLTALQRRALAELMQTVEDTVTNR